MTEFAYIIIGTLAAGLAVFLFFNISDFILNFIGEKVGKRTSLKNANPIESTFADDRALSLFPVLLEYINVRTKRAFAGRISASDIISILPELQNGDQIDNIKTATALLAKLKGEGFAVEDKLYYKKINTKRKFKTAIRNAVAGFFFVWCISSVILILNDVNLHCNGGGSPYGVYDDREEYVEYSDSGPPSMNSPDVEKLKNWRILFWGWVVIFIIGRFSYRVTVTVEDKITSNKIWDGRF